MTNFVYIFLLLILLILFNITLNYKKENFNITQEQNDLIDIEIPKKKLNVGIIGSSLPFSSCDKKGITIDIWENLSKKYKIDYEYVCYPRNYNKAIEDLVQNKIDVILGDISINTIRNQQVLFTRPYYIGEITLIKKQSDNLFYNILKNKILQILFISIFILLLFYALIVKIYNPDEDFSSIIYRVFIYFFGTVKENISTDIFPGLFPKLINSSFVFIKFLFFAVIITQLVSLIKETSGIISTDEFNGLKEINVLGNSTHVDIVKKIGKIPLEYTSNDEILEKLINSNKNEYWLDDKKTIRQAIKDSKYGDFEYISIKNPIKLDEYGIAINKNYPMMLEILNKEILKLQDNDEIILIAKRYIDDDFYNFIL